MEGLGVIQNQIQNYFPSKELISTPYSDFQDLRSAIEKTQWDCWLNSVKKSLFFDFFKVFVPEYRHSVSQGVFKLYTGLFTSTKNKNEKKEWFLG